MKIVTADFGEQEADPESVITFPAGLPGMEDNRHFKLYYEQEEAAVLTMQSLDSAEVAFSVANPATFNIGYEFTLTDEEVALIELDEAADAEILLILRKALPGEEVRTGVDIVNPGMRANIRSPIVLNTSRRLALQKALRNVEHYTVVKEV